MLDWQGDINPYNNKSRIHHSEDSEFTWDLYEAEIDKIVSSVNTLPLNCDPLPFETLYSDIHVRKNHNMYCIILKEIQLSFPR